MTDHSQIGEENAREKYSSAAREAAIRSRRGNRPDVLDTSSQPHEPAPLPGK